MENFIFNPPNKPAGLYHIPDMPDKPISKYYGGFLTAESQKELAAYEKNLSLALSQSIPVENNNEAKNMIYKSKGCIWVDLKPGEVYSLDCKVEKVSECDTCACHAPGCKEKKFVAVVSPKEEEAERPKYESKLVTEDELKDIRARYKAYRQENPDDSTFYEAGVSNKEQPKQEEKKDLMDFECTDKNCPHCNYEKDQFKKCGELPHLETETTDGTPVSLPHQESGEEEQKESIVSLQDELFEQRGNPNYAQKINRERYKIKINNKSFTHPNPRITGSEIKTYENLQNNEQYAFSVYLKTPYPDDDRKIADNEYVDLENPENNCFFTTFNEITGG